MTETIRTIPVDLEQARVLKEEFATLNSMDDTIIEIMMGVANRKAKKELDLWESVARLAGYEDGQTPEGVGIKVDHLNRQIIVTEKE